MKPLAFGLAFVTCCAWAQSLMDIQEKQKAAYGKCDSMTSQMLGSRDLDGDGSDEMIQLYAYDECAGKAKAGTAVVIFHKAGAKWKVAKGDSVLDSKATTYSLVESAQGEAKDVITLKNIFEDDAAPVKLQFAKGKVKRLK